MTILVHKINILRDYERSSSALKLQSNLRMKLVQYVDHNQYNTDES